MYVPCYSPHIGRSASDIGATVPLLRTELPISLHMRLIPPGILRPPLLLRGKSRSALNSVGNPRNAKNENDARTFVPCRRTNSQPARDIDIATNKSRNVTGSSLSLQTHPQNPPQKFRIAGPKSKIEPEY